MQITRIELFSATEVTYSYLLSFYKLRQGTAIATTAVEKERVRKPSAHKADMLRNEAHARTTIGYTNLPISSLTLNVYADHCSPFPLRDRNSYLATLINIIWNGLCYT